MWSAMEHDYGGWNGKHDEERFPNSVTTHSKGRQHLGWKYGKENIKHE